MKCMTTEPTRTSSCANGATWRPLEGTTQVLVVNTRTVNYREAMSCCHGNFGQLIKIDTLEKSTALTSVLNGLFVLLDGTSR